MRIKEFFEKVINVGYENKRMINNKIKPARCKSEGSDDYPVKWTCYENEALDQ